MLKCTLFTAALLSSAAVFAQGTPDQAAPAPDAAADPADSDDEVLVTATRTPTPAAQVASSVTVLDKAAIDRAQDVGVADLLLRTPGVSIARNGSYGTLTYLRVRGAEPDHTVVVIDGVKLNDPASTAGAYDFGNLLVGDASRVEVLRGPQSILWGSQAIGGVVNIVTPLPERALEGSFDVETGSRETISARVALGGKAGPLSWRVGGQRFSTDGISVLAGGTERDGYRNGNVAGRALLQLSNAVSAEVRGYYSDAHADLDGFGVEDSSYTRSREFVGYGGLNVALFDGKFRNRFGYGYTSIDRANYDPSLGASSQTFDALGRTRRFEYQGSAALGDAIDLTIGAEHERSRYRTEGTFSPLSRARSSITSFYGQLSARPVAGLTLTGGLRNDDHNRFGGKTQFSAGGAWALSTGTTLRANYGEGFKAPSLYQLFSDFGNTALRPEDAKGWEAGIEQIVAKGAVNARITYFERDTRDQIGFFSCSFTAPEPLCITPGGIRFGYYANIAKAEARGIEASASARIAKRVLIDGNYTWAAARDRTPGTTFDRFLARRPRHTANGSIDYTFESGGSAGAAVRWSGESFENATNTVRLAPYTLVDLRADVPVTANLRLFARVENVFDENYQTALGFGTLGRSFYAGLRGRF